MRTGTLIFLLLSMVPAWLAAGETYRDPAGRFSFEYPAGYQASSLGEDGVSVTGASSYVTVLVFPREEPGAAVARFARQVGPQWRQFTAGRHGETSLAGRPGVYAVYSGIDPKGVVSTLSLLAVADGAHTYLLAMASANSAYAQNQPLFDLLGKTFSLGTVRAVPAAAATPASAGPEKYYRLKKVELIDRHGFERPIEVLHLLVPTDWQMEGDVRWTKNFQCTPKLVETAYRVTSPDGRFAMESLPLAFWNWSEDPQTVQMMRQAAQQAAQFGVGACEVMPPMRAAEYLTRFVVPRARRGARIVGTEADAEMSGKLEQQAREMEAFSARSGNRVSVRTDAARVRLEYDLNGQPTEEFLKAATLITAAAAPTLNMYTNQIRQVRSYKCLVLFVTGMRAPKGQLDAKERLFSVMFASTQANPEWQGRLGQQIAQMEATNSRGAKERTDIWAKNGRETADIIKGVGEYRSKTLDRTNANFDDTIRGVQNYRNPATGETVALSNQYGHAWVNNRGEYLLSDSPGFDPNVALKERWTAMQPVTR